MEPKPTLLEQVDDAIRALDAAFVIHARTAHANIVGLIIRSWPPTLQ